MAMACAGFCIMQSLNKGCGLFAARDFEAGETILTEEPIVSCQFSWNKLYKYKACDYCMKSLETAQEMVRRLCADDSIVLPHPECCLTNSEEHTSCEFCDAMFCSELCRKKAVKEYHKTLCLCSANPLCNELQQLEESWRQVHYPPETSSIMIMARIIAQLKQAEHKELIIKNLRKFCSRTENEDENIIHKLLGEKFEEQISFLYQQISSCFYDDSVSGWFTLKGFKSFLGLLGTNQQGIGSSSFSIWVRNCDNLQLNESDRKELDSFIEELYEKMEEVSGAFLDCEGVGLYRLQSSCNHSCDPDAEVCFEHGNHKLTLKALKKIVSGSEIHISYLSECELSRSRHSRQKILSENYLFQCQCSKCLVQTDDPDVTSEDDDSDDSLET